MSTTKVLVIARKPLVRDPALGLSWCFISIFFFRLAGHQDGKASGACSLGEEVEVMLVVSNGVC